MAHSRTERRSRVRAQRRRLLLAGTAAAIVLAGSVAALLWGLGGRPAALTNGVVPTEDDAVPSLGVEPTASEQPENAETSVTAVAAVRAATPLTGRVVCLDPGHQAEADLAPEPVGPGATATKPRVTGGTTGVVTGQAEHELALDIAQRVERLLRAQGVTVISTRSSSKVNVSNRERAEMANRAGADLVVRIHADGCANAEARGVSTLYPSGNPWVQSITARSRAAAERIQAAVVAATDAPDRGVQPRDDLAGFNWSSVPVVLVEAGFLSNPVEDRLLADDAYRERVAEGIAGGVVAYLSD